MLKGGSLGRVAHFVRHSFTRLETRRCRYFAAKQYSKPAPPVLLSASSLQPRVACDEFHDNDGGVVSSPVRSWWPTIAIPSPLLLQLPQVLSSPAGNAVPSGCVPVR